VSPTRLFYRVCLPMALLGGVIFGWLVYLHPSAHTSEHGRIARSVTAGVLAAGVYLILSRRTAGHAADTYTERKRLTREQRRRLSRAMWAGRVPGDEALYPLARAHARSILNTPIHLPRIAQRWRLAVAVLSAVAVSLGVVTGSRVLQFGFFVLLLMGLSALRDRSVGWAHRVIETIGSGA
jgi:hypothetical protein